MELIITALATVSLPESSCRCEEANADEAISQATKPFGRDACAGAKVLKGKRL
jgi:hypothetical protein